MNFQNIIHKNCILKSETFYTLIFHGTIGTKTLRSNWDVLRKLQNSINMVRLSVMCIYR